VLEAADKAGGGSRTDETIPGHRFNTHSAAHNIINMTRIPAELDLAGAGLEYLPMDPFATGVFRDGRIVRFHRSVEQTCASIAEAGGPAEADAYRAFMHRAIPLVRRRSPASSPGRPRAACSRPPPRSSVRCCRGCDATADRSAWCTTW
jgi:phytoene dehydrogenase-like protein